MKNIRHVYAITHPCYEATDCQSPHYFDSPIHPVGRILTVNSGFE